jgi:DNA integrity scanning protein DisA with diadenylate cyclase activity
MAGDITQAVQTASNFGLGKIFGFFGNATAMVVIVSLFVSGQHDNRNQLVESQRMNRELIEQHYQSDTENRKAIRELTVAIRHLSNVMEKGKE